MLKEAPDTKGGKEINSHGYLRLNSRALISRKVTKSNLFSMKDGNFLFKVQMPSMLFDNFNSIYCYD